VIGNVIIPGAPRNSRAAAIDGKDAVLSSGVGEVIDSNVLAANAVVAGLYGCGDMTCSGTTPVFDFRRGRRGDQSPLSFFPNIKIGYEDCGGGDSRPGDGTEGERSSGDNTGGDVGATEVGKESCDPLDISLPLSSLPLCCTDTDRQNADLRVDVVASLASSDEGHSSVTAGVGGGDSTTGLRAVWVHKPGGTKRGALYGDVAGTISAAGRGDRFGLVKVGCCVNTPTPPVSAGGTNGLERFEFESRRNADLRKDGRAAGALLSLGERGKGERGLGKKERAFSISCCERARGIGEFGTFALKRCIDVISVVA
jgi:hypothetical protein